MLRPRMNIPSMTENQAWERKEQIENILKDVDLNRLYTEKQVELFKKELVVCNKVLELGQS